MQGGAAFGVRARARTPASGGQRRWERARCGYGRVWTWQTQVGPGLRRRFKGEKRGEREEGLTVEDACELEGSGRPAAVGDDRIEGGELGAELEDDVELGSAPA